MESDRQQQAKGSRAGLAARVAVVAALVVAVAAVAHLKGRKQPPADPEQGPPVNSGAEARPQESESGPPTFRATEKALPRLVDLGAGKCIPCKMMAPILEELRAQYAGRLEVVFIDVWENPSAGDQYGIRVIPTQIFYDAKGGELFRHEGFYAKDDILGKWRELGFNLQ